MAEVRVGTAGWTIPATVRSSLPGDGTQLERYSMVMNASEINSSFHRPHRRTTYERWASVVPSAFAFAVKIPKSISHVKRCHDCKPELQRFIDESAGLGDKRRLLLLQLPPSFLFDAYIVERFLDLCRVLGAPHIVCEPRHASWFGEDADAVLLRQEVARVAADPPPDPRALEPGGWRKLRYFRMHGAPRMYYSSYGEEALSALGTRVYSSNVETWCIFDNTASGAALDDALRLKRLVCLATRR
ncbi:MAG: DUF72 domain-containing protein [Candidatus Eremiobacteraeota bacterium]|nr:DUF72 domain-containing protein [Candidatus Eremiobacteraeota bacterium]